MSLVTNALLTFSGLEDVDHDERSIRVVEVNEAIEYLCLTKWPQRFADVACHAGGYKAFEAELYAGAFNYCDGEMIMTFIAAAEWRYPREVVAWIKEEGDDYFHEERLIEPVEPRTVTSDAGITYELK